MKIILDTNVVLDYLLAREPFAKEAKIIVANIEAKRIEGYLSPNTLDTIHYLVAKVKNRKMADTVVLKLLHIFEVSLIDKEVLLEAIANNGQDFEDSIIYTSAYFSKIDYLITRDKKGFKNAKVDVLNPAQFLAKLTLESGMEY